MFKNGTLWNDIDGNPIHAHGGWMLSYGGYFYWYGEDLSLIHISEPTRP